MPFNLSDYCNVKEKAQTLGLNIPEGLALLPRNFASAVTCNELLHESAVQTLRVLFRENDIPETRIEKDDHKFPCIQENEFALILPTLFVGTLILSQNPHLLALALNVIANYATDFFRGLPGQNKVMLDVVVEDKTQRRSKKIHYVGDVSGLKDIPKIASEVFTDEESH